MVVLNSDRIEGTIIKTHNKSVYPFYIKLILPFIRLYDNTDKPLPPPLSFTSSTSTSIPRRQGGFNVLPFKKYNA